MRSFSAEAPFAPTDLAAGQTRIVAAVLSRFLAGSRAKNSVATNRLCRGLALCGYQALPVDGAPGVAPFPNLPLDGWPTSAAALKRHGLSQAQLIELYEEAEHQTGSYASLDPELVTAIMPMALWPVVSLLIEEGPEQASQRAERAIRAYANRPIPGDRNKAAGPPSLASVKDMHATIGRLLRTVTELRMRGLADELSGWHSVPKLRLPRVKAGGRDTRAPRLEKVREALYDLNEQIAKKLGIREGDDELEALKRMPPVKLAGSQLFRLLRNRAALTLLVITGGRASEVAALRRSDYVSDHVGPSPDHRGGAAIMLRPGKNAEPGLIRPKVIPAAMARTILDPYVYFVERVFPVASEIAERHRPEFGPRRKSLPADFPLLVSDRVNLRPLGAGGLGTLLSGKLPNGSHKRTLPLIRRTHGISPELPAELRKYIGYHPHAFRHLAQQLADRAGEEWNAAHPPTGGAPTPEPGLFADALLDHEPGSTQTRIRMLYGDRNTEEGRELLAGRAISVMWELLTSDRGARRKPDLEQISRTAAEIRAIEAELQRCREATDRVHRSDRLPLPRKCLWPEPDAHTSVTELLRTIHRQNSSFAESQDLLHQRVDRAETVIRELLGLAEASFRLQELKEAAMVELTSLIYDRERWELVPDSAPSGAEHVELDLTSVLRGEDVLPAQLEPRAPDQVRDWLLVVEFCKACGVDSRGTVARWLSGSNLPREPSHRPWETDSIPLDDSLGPNYRRVWIPGVKDSFWPSAGSRARVAETLRRWPSQRGWARSEKPGWRCKAPLRLPDAFRARYEAERSPRNTVAASSSVGDGANR